MTHNIEHDLGLDKLRFSETKLYGRSTELSQLLNTFTSLADEKSQKTPEMVAISGRSGTGKTAIANQLRQPVKMKGGFFISGKFDPFQRMEPYTALIAAFTELSDIITNDIRALFRLKVGIMNAVGTQGKVLTDVIPSLQRIINWQGDVIADVRPLEAEKRFRYVLRNFVRAVCSPSHPVVLFLDDLQWADPASLEVIQTLLTDKENSSFLLVGSYRSNEVGPQHSVTKMLSAIEEDEVQITKIDVGNLSVQAVSGMLSDLLSEPAQTIHSLAYDVHCKTEGNVFYVVQFLMTLYNKGVLRYNMALMRWQWDSARINAMNVTQNVIDLLMTKIEDLSPDVRTIMQAAACLGSSFKLSQLKMVVEELDEVRKDTERGKQYDEKIKSALNVAGKEGLIKMDVDNTTYTFVHDQIQLAVFSSMQEDERRKFCYRIGEILLEKMVADELDKNLFAVVDLLNEGRTTICDTDSKVSLSKLNLKAGKKTLSSLAFSPCINYAQVGISLLEKDSWKEQYKLSLQLHNVAAEASYSIGNITETKYFVNLILFNAKSFDDKYHSYIVQIHTLAYEAKHAEATKKGLHILGEMGVYFPRIVTHLDIVVGFMKTKKLIKKLPYADLASLPMMEDKKKIKSMHLLSMLTLSAYHYNSRRKLMPLLIFKMVRWSIRYGICKFSPIALALYGMILCSTGDLRGGNDIGQLSLLLLDRLGAAEMRGPVYYLVHGFIMCWTRPAPLSMKPLIYGYQQGMVTGDVLSAMISIYFYTEFAFYSGYSLFLLEKDISKFCRQMKEYKSMILRHELILWQTVLNLMGRSDDSVLLTGSVMDQDEMLKESIQQQNANMTTALYFKQTMLYYYFGDYKMAGKLLSQLNKFTNYLNPSLWMMLKTFLEGLVTIALAHETKRRMWQKPTENAIKKMKRWAKNGNVNCCHMISLLEAELLHFKGKKCDAEQKYKEAIAKAAKCGFIHDRALATERFGMLFLRDGEMTEASHHLSEAYKMWMEWGAKAKAQSLSEHFPSLVFVSKCTTASQLGRKCTLVKSASGLIIPAPK